MQSFLKILFIQSYNTYVHISLVKIGPWSISSMSVGQVDAPPTKALKVMASGWKCIIFLLEGKVNDIKQ